MNNKFKGTLIFATLFVLIGCETGIKNKGTSTNVENRVESGIISKSSIQSYKPHIPSSSKIKKIYSKSGIPGYYIQVGYFKNHKPNDEFINRMEYAQLPYKIIKKYKNGQTYYYTLVGPYRSYSKAMEIIGSAKEYVTPNAFIVELVHP
jgi:hypothetical protein